MYFCSMIFVYPYKKSPEHFDILQSIAWIKRIYPEATIYTIGDQVQGALNIPCNQFNNIRGIDVTNRILTFARNIGGDFIYMNDDFYISEKFNPNTVLFNGPLQINPTHPPHYQEAARNTIEFLRYNGFPLLNYECHQPVQMSSDKLIKLFDRINWQDGNHFIKSIYLNVYKCTPVPGENLKLHQPNIAKASEFLTNYGCFSTGEAFLSKAGVEFLKRGFSLL